MGLAPAVATATWSKFQHTRCSRLSCDTTTHRHHVCPLAPSASQIYAAARVTSCHAPVSTNLLEDPDANGPDRTPLCKPTDALASRPTALVHIGDVRSVPRRDAVEHPAVLHFTLHLQPPPRILRILRHTTLVMERANARGGGPHLPDGRQLAG
jgi:hypothetical protein